MTAMVLISPEELEALVTRAAAKAIGGASPAAAGEPREVMTRVQVAELLHVNPHQIPTLIKKGLPMHLLGGTNQQRFLRAEVLEWIAQRKRA